MVMINLLPWRESQRVYQSKIVKKMLIITLFLNTILLFGSHFILAELKHKVQAHLANLEAELKVATAWRNSMRAFQTAAPVNQANDKLLRYRASIWQLFRFLEKNRSADICFTEIKRIKNKLVFTGKTRSVTALMMYLNDWHAVTLFSSIKIASLEQQSNTLQFRFFAEEREPFSWSMLGISSI